MRDTSAPAVPQSMSEFIMQIGRLQDCKSSFFKLQYHSKVRWQSLASWSSRPETQFLILETWEESILEFRESRVKSRNIMSLLLDWSLEEQIRQTDRTLLLQTTSNGFCNPCYSCDETKVALLKHICAEKMSWLTKFPACTGLLKQKSKLLVVRPWLKITTDW